MIGKKKERKSGAKKRENLLNFPRDKKMFPPNNNKFGGLFFAGSRIKIQLLLLQLILKSILGDAIFYKPLLDTQSLQ